MANVTFHPFFSSTVDDADRLPGGWASSAERRFGGPATWVFGVSRMIKKNVDNIYIITSNNI